MDVQVVSPQTARHHRERVRRRTEVDVEVLMDEGGVVGNPEGCSTLRGIRYLHEGKQDCKSYQ